MKNVCAARSRICSRRSVGGRDGMSLLIVLALLVALTGLGTAFALIMRADRAAGRGALEEVRARHLIPVGLLFAMDELQATFTTNNVYPDWSAFSFGTNAPGFDALASGSVPSPSLDMGTNANPLGDHAAISNILPASLWADAIQADADALWLPVPGDETNALNRVAYVIVNVSGLHDANALGRLRNDPHLSSNIVDGLFQIGDLLSATNFFLNFMEDEQHGLYESFTELLRINEDVSLSASNLFVYSYDPAPDQYFETNAWPRVGTRALIDELHDKLPVADTNLHANTNVLAWLRQAGFTNNAAQVAGNIVNYQHPSELRTPTPDGTDMDWTNAVVACGGQAVPLINEVGLQNVGGTNAFVTELWYPFYPAITTNNQYRLEIDVFTNLTADLDERAWTTNFPLDTMSFTNRPFLCYTNVTPFSAGPLYYTARVLGGTNGMVVVNEAMRIGTNATTIGGAFSVGDFRSARDPRANRRAADWDAVTNTPGAVNANFPYEKPGARLPIYHRGAPMRSIAELRHIYAGFPWRSLDLLDPAQGGFLMDRLTVGRDPKATGLIHPGTFQDDALRVLFHKAQIGSVNTSVSTNRVLRLEDATDQSNIVAVVDDMNPFARNFQELLQDSTNFPLLTADLFDGIPEWLTFRQNVFVVFIRAQALAPRRRTNAPYRPLAEARALVVVYRDAYTGRWRVRRTTPLPSP